MVSPAPAEIWVTPVRPLTLTGVEESVLVPSPSWPDWLSPQHLTVPPARRAQVWSLPAEIWVTPVRPLTLTGVEE